MTSSNATAEQICRSVSASDAPPTRLVRHCFCKYPIVAGIVLIIVAVLAAMVGSPNWPRTQIATAATKDPGGAILAFTQELDGTSASSANADENGVGDPAEAFVIGPLRQAAPLLHSSTLDSALATYAAADYQQRLDWATAYDKALDSVTPKAKSDGADTNSAPSSSATDMSSTAGSDTGSMGGTPSPDYQRIAGLKGDFGPVPVLTQEVLSLAKSGYLEQYLLAVHPGHSFHLVDIWLYDHPAMLNDAVADGLTDDQWGMVKERGFSVGPWYLFLPAVIHVLTPNGSDGQGFVIDNLLLALFFLFGIPLIPGLRDLPRHLRFYRLIYHYPLANELEKAEYRARPDAYHGR
ncbi:MAG: hypothetical protein M1582_01300 [Actinobacteria bacterium]|nr:hypothetical protein [Actinomycetota bacterium]